MDSGAEIIFDHFAEILKAMVGNLDNAIDDAAETIASKINAKLGATIPVAVTKDNRDRIVEIGDPSTFYVGFLEYGTRYRPARPVVVPAAESERGPFVRRASDLERGA